MPGTLIIITAPSGAGKTTLVRGLLDRDPQVHLSVSYTTRSPRPGEENGRAYHFVDTESFRELRDRGEFLEWAEVHGNYYATSRTWIREQMAAGRDIVLEIDWQGAVQVQRLFPDAIGIFVVPPSIGVLRERLTQRGQDSAEVIERRVAAAEAELKQAHRFQYVIINQDFASALGDLRTIVEAARLRFTKQQARHPATFAALGIAKRKQV